MGTVHAINQSSPPRELTKEFLDCFRGYGSPSLTCGCGRIHVGEDDPNLDEEEREQYLRHAERSPRSYVITKHAPMGVTLGGIEYVLGCPCEYGPRLEDIVWQHRAEFARYISVRTSAIVSQESAVRAALEPVIPQPQPSRDVPPLPVRDTDPAAPSEDTGGIVRHGLLALRKMWPWS